MGIIFVAGVHGVGKTIACTHAANSLGLTHYSSSGLIKLERADAISTGSKAVSDVDENQSLLIRSVRNIYDQHSGPIILDGHFALLKTDGKFEEVSVDVFGSLIIKGIVVYRDEPEAIAQRLLDRDKTAPDPVVVGQHQTLELKQAHLVANDLNIPIRVLKAFDVTGLLQLISEWTTSKK